MALSALALCVATEASAQQPSPAAKTGGAVAFEEEFKKADVDKDGKLSEQEAVSAGFFTDGSFKEVDHDGDGQVTLFELGDALQDRLRKFMADEDAADTNKDGYVDAGEAEAAGPSFFSFFKKADRDGDGKIARDEIDVYTRDTYYSETSDRGVVPNIFEKKF